MRFPHVLVLLAACSPAAAPQGAPLGPPPPAPTVPAPPSAPQPPRARQLAAETPVTTASGATFTAPPGWWLTQDKEATTLEDPDRQLRATLLETNEADVERAALASWKRVHPDFALKVRDVNGPPPIRGWDTQSWVAYETPAAEHRQATALVRRRGNVTLVALLEGPDAAFGRRGAQLDTALWTFRYSGQAEESFQGQTPKPFDAARAKELEAFAEDARQRLGIVGSAVAVLQNDKIVFEKGFGARALGGKEKVTPSTLFMIGSITKSMTTFLQATLVDEGKMRWDTPVTQLLPDFALADPEVTKRLVMWHTSCACTGMPRQDLEFIFEFDNVTPEQRIASMRAMKPTTAFGETFQYSNLMVAAGGYAAARALDPKGPLGPAYDAAMKARVFGPMGMTATTLDFKAAERADHAMPHSWNIDGDVKPVAMNAEHFVLPVRPAGGAWSSVHDMARYVATELANGVTPEGKRVVSEANLLERRKPRVRSGEVDSYALGLGVGKFRDLPLVSHTGGTLGFHTLMFYLPEQHVGVVVLTNTVSPQGYMEIVQRKVMELFFEGRDLARLRLEYRIKRKPIEVADEHKHVLPEAEKGFFEKLAGTYANEALGKVKITLDGKGGAVFDAGEWKSPIVETREDDGTIKVKLTEPPMAGFELTVDGATLIADTAQQKYVFVRS
jgi:CubicO group peptidase (beta-lactamase class C family)